MRKRAQLPREKLPPWMSRIDRRGRVAFVPARFFRVSTGKSVPVLRIALWVCIASYGWVGAAGPSVARGQAFSAPQPPEVSARSGVLWDLSHRTALWEKSSEQSNPLASTSKLMTAIVVMRKTGLLGDVVVNRQDLIFLGGSYAPTVRLVPGDRIPVRELVKALVIASSNEAANVLARYCSGSVARFVQEMNASAQEMGCKGTHFADPHGLSPDTRGTASDLVRIFERFLRFPLLAHWAAQTSDVLRDSEGRPLQLLFSTNRLSGIYPGLGPAKTGWTSAAGHSYVAVWGQGERKAILVLLGSRDPWQDAWHLLDYLQSYYRAWSSQ